MKILLIIVGLTVLTFACPALVAQRNDSRARDITERSEYRGYRVERRPGSDFSGGEDGGEDGGRADGDGAERRGAGAGGPPRRDSGRGGGSGGGGLNMPQWIGSLFTVIAWVVIIAGLVIALFFIVKALLGIKWGRRKKAEKSKQKKKPAETTDEEAETFEDEDFNQQVFGDALEVALREYKEAVAREDFAAATMLAYRIFWLRAGWKGCVEPSDTHTWRDALRMVRQTETRRDVRELLPLVERVRYASHVPQKFEFNNWSLKLERINPQGVL